ncbi:hypothetical protein HGRIS_011145 [Hohenbuehelia grisea]|uniref:Fungal-type protein kinase domain-containing protein n=1 Tax=Hohenbuehelia grisea TaxID=104357 RepID=A0ABR3IYZ7_9AGAR
MFVEEHLNSGNVNSLQAIATAPDIAILRDAYVDQAKNGRGTYDQYAPLGDLLNKLVEHVCAQLPDITADEHLVFHDYHLRPPRNCPDKDMLTSTGGRPDFVVVCRALLDSILALTSGNTLTGIAWHHLESVVEDKLPDQNYLQLTRYLGYGNQARPDMLGTYGLSVDHFEYAIAWSDPSGVYLQKFPWDNLLPLVQFVYTLHHPRDDHIIRDPSFELAGETPAGDPIWNIQYLGMTYERCERIFVGRPWTRMPWVARSRPYACNDGNPYIIKDSYVHCRQRWAEASLFKHLHSEGPAPGWVDIHACGYVPARLENSEPPIQTPIHERRQTKTRLVMRTSGDPFSQASSLVHYLKVVYDALEAHRWAVRERRILHRDVSPMNILINVQGLPSAPCAGAKFIDDILPPKHGAMAKPYAVLCDLDNGCRLDEISSQDDKLQEITGTPMYIARSVSLGTLLGPSDDFYPMPSLSDPEQAWYEAAHSDSQQDPMRVFVDGDGKTHGGIYSKSAKETYSVSVRQSSFEHRPSHDVESLFWCLFARLLRARPLDHTQTDFQLGTMSQYYSYLVEHEIGRPPDPRVLLLDDRAPRSVWGDAASRPGKGRRLADGSSQPNLPRRLVLRYIVIFGQEIHGPKDIIFNQDTLREFIPKGTHDSIASGSIDLVGSKQ